MLLKSSWRFALAALLVFSSLDTISAQDEAAEQPAGAAEKPQNHASYLLGLTIGEQMRSQGLKAEDIDVNSLAMAIADELAGNDPRLSDEELQAASEAMRTLFQSRMQARMQEQQKEMEAAAAANQEKANMFLEENAKKEGVKKLVDGLQYKVEKQGDGPSPTVSNQVSVHYTGKLLNGEVFDSSVQRGQPATFPVNGLIKAWQLALPKMKVGDKWTIYAAPELAYGLRGSPPKIGPNELLIFEMELLEIVK